MSDVRRALVVEDNPAVLIEAVGILEDVGFDVISTFDADSAMRWLAENVASLSLLFTNVELPGRCNGFEIARWARQENDSLPIVVASGRLAPENGDLPFGALFLPKPYDTAQLIAAIEEACDAGLQNAAQVG